MHFFPWLFEGGQLFWPTFWCLTPDLGSEAVFSIISKLLWQVDLRKNLLFYTHTNKITCCHCPLSLLFCWPNPWLSLCSLLGSLPMCRPWKIYPWLMFSILFLLFNTSQWRMWAKMKDPLSLNMTFGLEHLLQTNNAWTAPECDQSHLYATTKEDLFLSLCLINV